MLMARLYRPTGEQRRKAAFLVSFRGYAVSSLLFVMASRV